MSITKRVKPEAEMNKKVWVWIALTTYGAVFAEAFVRVVAPQPVMPRYVMATPLGIRGNIPNALYWHHTGEGAFQYQINSEGMRSGRDFPATKPPGVCRIALLGDSFFMGYEVRFEDSFAAVLEQRLNELGINVEVLNFAVSGFGTAEELKT